MRIEMHMRISMLGFVGSLYNTKEECDQIMDFRLEQTYFGVKSEMLVYSDNQVSWRNESWIKYMSYYTLMPPAVTFVYCPMPLNHPVLIV